MNVQNFDLETRRFGSETLSATGSYSANDTEWDAYLQTVSTGHFQQSSLWGQIKAMEGWKVVRVVVRESPHVVRGGFQLLVRRRGFLREAFLNKGPVFSGPPSLARWHFELLEKVLVRERIHVLLAQPPDSDSECESLFSEFGYLPNVLGKIIAASFWIPLDPALPPVEIRMRRSLRLEARQAKKRGVIVREGGAGDIPDFFQLMSASAQRQHSSPNPADESALLALWRTFHGANLARLTIAEDAGRPIAGLLSLRFGDRVTQWKKGWNGESREKHPNTLLAVESIEWAQSDGAKLVDFAGGDRTFIRSLLSGEPPSEARRHSRDFYLVGLGGEGVLLPLPRVRIRNPFGSWLYSALVATRRRQGRLEL